MKNKEKVIYIILGLVFIITIITILFIYNNKMAKKADNIQLNYSYKIEDFKLSDLVKNELSSKNYNVIINNLNKDLINGIIEKDIGGGVLTSKGVFSYDNTNLTTKYYDFKGLVIDYLNYNDKVYYILENDDVSSYSWELIENNLELSNPKVLMSGHDSYLNANPIIFVENNNLYFVYADDIFNKNNKLVNQDFAIYQISDEKEKTELLNYPSNDEYVINLESDNHYNNNYYYQTKYDDKYNLYSLDLSTMNTNLLISSDTEFNDYLSMNGKDAYITKYNQFIVNDGHNNIADQKYSGTIKLFRITDSKALINTSDANFIYDANTNTIVEINLGNDFDTYTIKPYMDNKLLLQTSEDFKILTFEY
jgi:hypothetical protein